MIDANFSLFVLTLGTSVIFFRLSLAVLFLLIFTTAVYIITICEFEFLMDVGISSSSFINSRVDTMFLSTTEH